MSSRLAPKYFNVRFLRVFVESVPFLVEILALKVLPCDLATSGVVGRGVSTHPRSPSKLMSHALANSKNEDFVICFIRAVLKDRHIQWVAVHTLSFNSASRIVGFEELGSADSFSAATLELRLMHTGWAFSCGRKRRDLNISFKV